MTGNWYLALLTKNLLYEKLLTKKMNCKCSQQKSWQVTC